LNKKNLETVGVTVLHRNLLWSRATGDWMVAEKGLYFKVLIEKTGMLPASLQSNVTGEQFLINKSVL